MATQLFYVRGMTCSGCERTLERAVSQLDGVHSVQADRQKGQLEVDFSQPCTPPQTCRFTHRYAGDRIGRPYDHSPTFP